MKLHNINIAFECKSKYKRKIRSQTKEREMMRFSNVTPQPPIVELNLLKKKKPKYDQYIP